MQVYIRSSIMQFILVSFIIRFYQIISSHVINNNYNNNYVKLLCGLRFMQGEYADISLRPR